MDADDVVVLVVAAAVVAGTGIWFAGEGRRRAFADRFARQVDLRLEERGQGQVAERLARREVVGVVFAVVAAVATALLVDVDDGVWRFLTVMVGAFAGKALGGVAVAAYESTRPLPPAPRIARASTPSHGDYVAPVERVGGWVAVGMAVVAAGAAWVAQERGLLLGVGLPMELLVSGVVVPPAVLVVDELGARWLLRRRQTAATTLELAWDDALRSRTLRDGVTAVLMAGLYTTVALVAVAGDRVEGGWPENPTVGVVSGVSVLLVVAVFAVGVVSTVSRPERHFRRRLWPRPVDSGVSTAAGVR